MNYNKYEALLGSVTKAEMFANRMNACVEAVRSKGKVCRRDLLAQIPNPNYYLDLLERFGVVKSEVHAEEFIEVKEERYLYREGLVKENSDGTVSYMLNGRDEWHTLHNATVEFCEGHRRFWDCWHVVGYQTVQVKRKYWIWKA